MWFPGTSQLGVSQFPRYLTIFKSDKEEDYEPKTGCLRWMNKFSRYHNQLLMKELKKLRKLHPGVTIIYADNYGAAMEIFLSPEQYGESLDICLFLLLRILVCTYLNIIFLTN